MMVNGYLSNFSIVSFSCSSYSEVLPHQQEVEQPHCRDAQGPTIRHHLLQDYYILFVWPAPCTSHHSSTARPVERPLGGEKPPEAPVYLLSLRPALPLDPVRPLWQEHPAWPDTCWWCMELAIPPNHCKADTWPRS